MFAFSVLDGNYQLFDFLIFDNLYQLVDLAAAGEVLRHHILVFIRHFHIPDDAVAGIGIPFHNVFIGLQGHLVAADDDCAETDFAASDFVDGGRGDAHTGDIGGEELQSEQNQEVQEVVVVHDDVVIQNEGKEEEKASDKCDYQCVT